MLEFDLTSRLRRIKERERKEIEDLDLRCLKPPLRHGKIREKEKELRLEKIWEFPNPEIWKHEKEREREREMETRTTGDFHNY